MMNKVNYHTHTYRCGHAKGNEEEMVEAAIQAGYQTLGMSCHVPLKNYRWHLIKSIPSIRSFHSVASMTYAFVLGGPHMRMPYRMKQEYLDAIDEAAQKHEKEIKVYKGFECEYFEEYLPYYQEMLDSGEVDYLILGHHFSKHSIHSSYYGKPHLTKKELYQYCNDVEKAMETNLFSYVAHPDLYMIGYKQFDADAKAVTRRICEKAKALDIPLELNAGGIRKGLEVRQGHKVYPYANEYFFKVASEVGNKIILGIDAHTPDHLKDGMYALMLSLSRDWHLSVIDTFEMRKGKK